MSELENGRANRLIDSLPVYNLTHDIRLLITSRCETTLTWEQLRSPQVSAFLLKPIITAILASHFSKATLYALMANALQFRKEADLKPGISGASKTRALVAELLAIKLLKEYGTRDLIDALSYNFHPLQGQGVKPMTPPGTSSTLRPTAHVWDYRGQKQLRAVRISCLEIAIRAQAKRFLAHPVVVQHLEAIWAGSIVFHSAADSLHRAPKVQRTRGYGAVQNSKNDGHGVMRRSATLYNPRYASLFKLSRLRVPRYRQFLSTVSFAILLGLFLAVINRREMQLTSLELVFWFWSAGFMLDEIVGFNEQGFSLYLMSFWNVFDVGILVLLVIYYFLRIYSVVMVAPHDQEVANLAYDVLAANAVLLVPRLFSVLDHYRYFSQLLIAFRMMLADLAAVLVLIIIACSGFFVAFTSSFGSDNSPGSIAYALFQMVMGFTPAAWTLWQDYNLLGKAILTLFLFICHFLVVTILITVLTNSFMAIASNANDEHQFVFAVNTISSIKSDALFSYVAPTNILAWLLAPLRFCMPFHAFIKLNRMVIKTTHFPVLWGIYAYERFVLSSALYEPTDLVERKAAEYHTAARRLREPSIADLQKDRALDEVFRPIGNGRRMGRIREGQRGNNTHDNVDTWMQAMGSDDDRLPPEEQDRDIVEELERGNIWRARVHKRRKFLPPTLRDFTATTRTMSVASDPEEYPAHSNLQYKGVNMWRPQVHLRQPNPRNVATPEGMRNHPTDVDGDDELSTNDEMSTHSHHTVRSYVRGDGLGGEGWSATAMPLIPEVVSSRPSTVKLVSPRRPRTPEMQRNRHHIRTLSSGTVLYNPVNSDGEDENANTERESEARSIISEKRALALKSGMSTPTRNRHRRHQHSKSQPLNQTAFHMRQRPGPGLLPLPMSVPDTPALTLNRISPLAIPAHPPRGMDRSRTRDRGKSFSIGLGSDLGDNKAVGGGFVGLGLAGMGLPGSFTTTNMNLLYPSLQRLSHGGNHRPSASVGHSVVNAHELGDRDIEDESDDDDDDHGSGSRSRDMLNKLVLARMKNLEETFRDVVREVKDLRLQNQGPSAVQQKPEKERSVRPRPPMLRAKSERDAVAQVQVKVPGKEKKKRVSVQPPRPTSDDDGDVSEQDVHGRVGFDGDSDDDADADTRDADEKPTRVKSDDDDDDDDDAGKACSV